MSHVLLASSPKGINKTMYPKVKVKEQEEDDRSAINLRPPFEDFDALSTYNFNSPASEYRESSPTSVVRIPGSYVSSPASVLPGGAKIRNKKKPAETISTAPNIRASPILTPRAILSSPENDGLMRSKNNGKEEPVSGLKDHNLDANRHVKCKAAPRRSIYETTKRQPKGTCKTKSNLKVQTRASVFDTRQQAIERKQRPEWI